MGVRRGWLKLMDPPIGDWGDVHRAYKNLELFVKNLGEQVFYARRGPYTGSPTMSEGEKVQKLLGQMSAAIDDLAGKAKHWQSVQEGKSLPGFRQEEGESMLNLYRTNFPGASDVSLERSPGKWKNVSLTDLMDKVLKILREDAARVKDHDDKHPETPYENLNVFKEFDLHGMKIVIGDPKALPSEINSYVRYLKEAYQRVQQKGLGKLWRGTLLLTSTEFKKLTPLELEAYRELGYASIESQAGTYHSGEDIVKITAPPDGRLVRTIVHELGHRYWFKVMRPEQRARFNGLVKTNPSKKVRDFPSGPLEDDVEKPVTPVSDYGASSIEEAFAEVFDRYVLETDMNRDQLESFRSVLAATKVVDEDLIESLRKDFLVLLKNIPRVTDYKTGARLREAFVIYKKRFDELFFKQFLNEYKSNGDTRFEGLRKPAWDLYIELSLPLGYPDEYVKEETRFAYYQTEVKTWEPRIRSKAQKFWKAAKEALSYQTSPVEVQVQDVDRLVMEGFQVEVVGYDPNSSWQSELIPKFKESLRRYRRNAAKTVPWLLKNQLPLEASFKTKLDEGGEYRGRYIYIALTIFTTGDVDNGVHVLAHEMGHHMYKGLSKPAREFWDTAIRQDYGPLDLAGVLAKWPSGMRWASDFVEMMATKDPVLALQVDVLSMGHGNRTRMEEREDFQNAYDGGTLEMAVPQSPITGYAGKNSEESFCEAIGRLVAYGPRAILPIVRHWLEIAIPGDVKTAAQRVVDRYGNSLVVTT
jgi:hypothetical protein